MCSKHVEAWNKLIIKLSASSWLILRNKYIEMHGQQNIKKKKKLQRSQVACFRIRCWYLHIKLRKITQSHWGLQKPPSRNCYTETWVERVCRTNLTRRRNVGVVKNRNVPANRVMQIPHRCPVFRRLKHRLHLCAACPNIQKTLFVRVGVDV